MSFMIRSHCWSGLMVIKHSSVRSVLIHQNCPTRTRIKLDIVFWFTVFRVRIENTKQNKYSKVLWPCGFTPCFGSSRQFYFCHIIIFFIMFRWYWFDYLDCDLFCIFPFNIGVFSPYLHSELNGCYESHPATHHLKKMYLEDQSKFVCIFHYFLNTETSSL